MKINKVIAAYFSPTEGTKKYVTELAGRLSEQYETLDLTKPDVREQEYTFEEGDLVLLGAPVYAGRIPQVEGGIFSRLQGNGAAAVYIVTYGNREYEDALLELKDMGEENGFVSVAAGAWIAPHSFSARIAAGRPDQEDLQKLEEFANAIKSALAEDQAKSGTLQVPGNHPYRDLKAMPFHPAGTEGCTNCGRCAEVCPVNAIAKDNPKVTDEARCITCAACVKVCPEGARLISGPMFAGAVAQLEAGLLNVRKEPQYFV